MAQCVKCKQFFPPGFTRPTEDNKANICEFCLKESDTIKDDDGTKWEKNKVIKEYDIFIKKVMERPNVKEKLLMTAWKANNKN